MKKKVVVILHNSISKNATQDELDGLVQVEAVEKSLKDLGYRVERVEFEADIGKVVYTLSNLKPDLVFNLVEDYLRRSCLVYLPANILETYNFKFTGGTGDSIYLTTNKVITKELLELNNISTPGWYYTKDRKNFIPASHYILKTTNEDASIGIDSKSVIFANKEETLEEGLNSARKKLGFDFFAEKYIEGREFNIALLKEGENLILLPPSEIEFLNFEPGRFKILDFKAKWEVESFEYINTVRRVDFSPSDNSLIEQLKEIAVKCWNIFKVKGYARVDFRVDNNGKPYVLELNVNPCISPDSGFVASAKKAGMDYTSLIKIICNNL